MKTITIDEYTPYGTNHSALYATYKGDVLFDEVKHSMLKEDLRRDVIALAKRNGFTHWKRPNSTTKYDINKGIK